MKIEYLLIKPNNDFCTTTKQFKSLLLSNKRLALEGDKLLFSEVSFDYTLTASEVNWKKKKEILFYFSVSTCKENADKLENFDILLHRIIDTSGYEFKINTIWDDVSIYYTNMLYPSIVEVENLFRKLIYRFMIKTAGSAWFTNAVPESVKETIQEKVKKNNLNEYAEVDQLYLADFIQLGRFFFEKYTTKPLSQYAIQELKKIIVEGDNFDAKLKEFLDTYDAKSNWERYFEDKLNIENLYEKWQSLYGYRNCVAHAKRMNNKDYKTATTLVSELKDAFENCLTRVDAVKMTEEEAEAVQQVAKETISSQQKTDSDPTMIKYPSIFLDLTELSEAAASFKAQLDLEGISKAVKELAMKQQSLIVTPDTGTNSLFGSEMMAAQTQIAESIKQQAIKATEPYLRTLDAKNNATEVTPIVPKIE